jgi:hypothetical protein
MNVPRPPHATSVPCRTVAGRWKRVLPGSALLGCWALLGSAAWGEDAVSFKLDIRPILSDKCFFCHGPDANRREADLRLDREEDAKEYAIVPGDVAASELIARITAQDAQLRMPPASSKLELSDQEIGLIRRWIEQGAVWDQHWAFIPPGDVQVPRLDDPKGCRNAIDSFIRHRLEQEGLRPAPEAGREALLRRVTFDLTGLPPTLEEIDAFVDDASPEAYERVVDRLLASERFGERLAADWLDAARYSDTYGYQVDRDRYVWPWRDWVINACNANLSYDQFLMHQLAGDLLPDATEQTTLATAFNRLHPQKVEGGSVPEEFRIEYVADRTQTVATAVLGLTMECCRCHDHKYDPISQKEYYQLSAFFDNIDEAGLYSFFTPAVPTPTLVLADPPTKARLAAIEDRIAAAERDLHETATGRTPQFQKWLDARRRPRTTVGESSDNGTAVASAAVQRDAQPPETSPPDDESLIPDRLARLDFEQPAKPPNQSVPGRFGSAVQLTGDDGVPLEVGNFRRFEPFSVALWLWTPDVKQRAVVYHRSRAWTDAASRGYELLIEDGRLSAALIHFWPGNAIRVRTRKQIPTRQWLHVAVTWDGSSRADGLTIYVDGQPADCDVIRDHLRKNITGGGGDQITIGERFRDRGFTGGRVDEFRVYARELTAIEIAQLHDQQSLASLLEEPLEQGSEAQRAALFAYYLSVVDDAYRTSCSALQKVREERSQLVDGLQEIMVMRELPEPRPTFLLARGAYDAPGDRVQPGTPAALPAFPEHLPRNRLGLARWLTAKEHPLTARVAVNRFWQLIFGSGLVRTPEDFGSQGQPPTHPELLDWLARDFVSHGWDVKRLLKQLVMSATYRQSSVVSVELLARDPENRLWARAPSYRWPAEMLRDNALAVSGLLVNRIGGPPAKPYEVEVSFKPVDRDKGEGLYRRSVYTFWKRTGPAPVMMTLDAAKRDVCRVRRERTSSPLQAFVLMNGPQFVEAARGLSERLLQRHGDDTDAVLIELFRTLTSRRPEDDELRVIRDLFESQRAGFQATPDRAKQYLEIGDRQYDASLSPPLLAAITTVANVLFSYDECVIKR